MFKNIKRFDILKKPLGSVILYISFLQDMGYDFSKYPNILKWTQTVSEQIPEYETVVTQTSDGLQQLLQSRKQEENENEQ